MVASNLRSNNSIVSPPRFPQCGSLTLSCQPISFTRQQCKKRLGHLVETIETQTENKSQNNVQATAYSDRMGIIAPTAEDQMEKHNMANNVETEGIQGIK